MIDYIIIKEFLIGKNKILNPRTMTVSFRKLKNPSDEDVLIIKEVINTFVNGHFIFTGVEENKLIDLLMEKLNDEEKSKISIITNHHECRLSDYENQRCS